ncbi:hypothetical protein J6590_082607 [Homalodisca vitripennis]|nr:hypothetical protein J6590_082607 [Homalodisca vitripennis]
MLNLPQPSVSLLPHTSMNHDAPYHTAQDYLVVHHKKCSTDPSPSRVPSDYMFYVLTFMVSSVKSSTDFTLSMIIVSQALKFVEGVSDGSEKKIDMRGGDVEAFVGGAYRGGIRGGGSSIFRLS